MRGSPLVDFVDVRSGKEEADSKLRRKYSSIRGLESSKLTGYRGPSFSGQQPPVYPYPASLLP